MTTPAIDRKKLHVAIRKMGNNQVFFMLEEAIELLPQTKLNQLAKQFLDLSQLRPDASTKGCLLTDVMAFEKVSLKGQYYEDFMVNSKNCTEMSKGTRSWIAECNRLLDRCVNATSKGDPVEVRQAFGTIFSLLDHIDECLDDIVFFADEAGSWQVSVDWRKVLPAWFTCLSATSEPEDYARRVVEVIENHEGYNRTKHLATAKKLATPEQKKALKS
jgi:hypothetical protein